MNILPTNVTKVTNDIEESFTYMQGEIRTDLSILTSVGNEPACICRSQYREGQDVPLSEEMIHIPSEEKGMLIDLLKRSEIL